MNIGEFKMTEFDEVYEKIKKCLVESCGLKEEEIELNRTLMDDLGVDSIDLIDLIYSLEKQYAISIEIGEFEKIAAKELGDTPFEKDNIITDEGLKVLYKLIGESQKEKIQKGLMVQQIPFLFTVHSICNLVMKKLAAKRLSIEK